MFDERLRTYLIRSELSVGQRVYPMIVPVDPVYPLIIISQPGAIPVNHRDTHYQPSVFKQVTKIFKSYGETLSSARATAQELEAAILRFKGSIYNQFDDYETQSKRYVCVTIAQFWSHD
jgi:methylthioribose-1-phosphate isomerase